MPYVVCTQNITYDDGIPVWIPRCSPLRQRFTDPVMRHLSRSVLVGAYFFLGVSGQAQSWCGKYYDPSQIPQSQAPPPGGQFSLPTASQDPLLAFRCSLSSAGLLDVTVSLGGKTLSNGAVPLNATAYEIAFSLDGITAQMTPYNLSCQATYTASGSSSTQTFSTSTALYYLPNPTNSAVIKMDLRTGALLAKPANGQGGDYQPVFPIGFYTEFQYLATNLTVIDELHAQGFTISGTRVTKPDGSSDPLNATSTTYDLIYNIDGYHPVSLVLNCQDYYWSTYAAGADILMLDVYMTGVNVNVSSKFNTTCTTVYGVCGCDNCSPIPAGDTNAVPPNTLSSSSVPADSGIGSFFDVSDRVSSFINRMEVMGWERTKAVWTVPQAFGGDPGDLQPSVAVTGRGHPRARNG
ncbi:hypothetical protein BU15DRAFT_65213 [Melanogaster broomeanus]|nr:hypothetical protein BU15DRAFT_65213 [Melanogaster broomeanus]